MKSLSDYRTEVVLALESIDPSLVTEAEIKRQLEYIIPTDRDHLESIAKYHVAKATEALTEPYRALHANRVVSLNVEIGHLENLLQEIAAQP